MALLIIEGEPGAINWLSNEIFKRNYIDAIRFYSAIIDSPEIILPYKWSEFLCDFKRFLDDFDFPGLS
ncbi:MAG: hypothetical protein H8D67_30875 [Deltaproteobacteria bacterium]|nr:hypothetical protein [Deltaproteobacteria bacterium]